MEAKTLVRTFNRLDRQPTTPSGAIENHWHFSIRHVPLDPPGDMLHLINPGSRFQHVEGPAQIQSLPTPEARAEVVFPLLLTAFTGGIGAQSEAPLFGPWSWSTPDNELADALEAKLRAIGVKQDLCTIRPATDQEDEIAAEGWSSLVGMLMQTMGQDATSRMTAAANTTPSTSRDICANCKKSQSALATRLKNCAKCRNICYCSRDCQKADWKQHKKVCGKQDSVSLGPDSFNERSMQPDAASYYNNIAHTNPEAQSLAKEINLDLPRPGSSAQRGILAPIRRLIQTGKDTVENYKFLLGPDWEKSTSQVRHEQRLHVLLRPPHGSPDYALHAGFDQGCPFWTPRDPSHEEQEELKKIRDMQNVIRQYMDSHSIASISTHDMQTILESFPNWYEILPIYQVAIRCMDQGVSAP